MWYPLYLAITANLSIREKTCQTDSLGLSWLFRVDCASSADRFTPLKFCLESSVSNSLNFAFLSRRLAACLSIAALTFSSMVQAEDSPRDVPEEPSDMTVLFNGEDLSGWNGDERLWSVVDGVIHGETTKENAANGNTFLIWQDGSTKDFELRLSFRCNATNNSGIQYRSKHIQNDSVRNDWVVRGYQHEIRNEEKFPNVSGFIYDEGGKRGRICVAGEIATWEPDGKNSISTELIDQEEFSELMKIDDWNDVVIIAKGNHILHYLNGRLILDFTDNAPELALTDGKLALQLHAGRPMFVEFKDIRFKDLSK
jgi:hypothetical protein